MNLFVALLLTCLIMAVGIALTLLLINFNWKLLTVWNGGGADQFNKIGTMFRDIDSIEGPLLEDGTRTIIRYVYHVTFFACDIRYLGNLAVCYTATDLSNFRKRGYHWRGSCRMR